MNVMKAVVLSKPQTTLHGVRSETHRALLLMAWLEANLVSLVKNFLLTLAMISLYEYFAYHREEGGGASLGTQPSMIAVPVNIPLPEASRKEIFLSGGNDSVKRGQILKLRLS